MYQVNDYVFYESGGICKIEDVRYAPLENMPADCQYYVMQSVHDSNGVMYIPVDSDRIFLRRLMSREEAEQLVQAIPIVDVIKEPNAKLLRAKYIEAMRTHEPLEWVRVIKTVYARIAALPASRSARLSETERSFFENAKRYLYTELSLALGMEIRDVEAYFTSRIETTV